MTACRALKLIVFFFFNDTATTEIYTLSLHDALPISGQTRELCALPVHLLPEPVEAHNERSAGDRKSTRLNSSHLVISYAVFCLKKKKKINDIKINTKKYNYKK